MRGTLKFARRGRLAATMVAIVLGAAASLAGCSWLHFGSQDDETYDYRKAKPRQEPLEVPPDLSQLPKDDRYSLPSTASAAKPANANTAKPADAGAGAAPAGASSTAAPETASSAAVASVGQVVAPAVTGARIMRDGDQRWLAVDGSPELAYATVKELWTNMGFKIATDEPQLGILETDWSENRPMVDEDAVRNALHRVFGAFDSNGERNKYRARIERTAKNTAEITITQRGMVEILQGVYKETSKWQAAPSNPELEYEMLDRVALRFATAQPLQVATGSPASAATLAASGGANGLLSSTSAAAAPVPASRVHKVTVGGFVTLQVEDTQDHTWRQVGVALDRGGFTIEDRNRDKSMYSVRYLDPDYEASEKEKRSWWDRLFNADAKVPEQQFRIVVSANGPITAVEVQDHDGKPDNGPTAKRILDQLMEQLR
ncbi:putative Outer membrane protein assembly factor BamC [Burkholderiales bacterium]|nr:putative Outer membrane protein assembly factor BamC [Burkholderiales bacterium]